MVKESQRKRHEHMIHTFMNFFLTKNHKKYRNLNKRKGLEEEKVQRKCQQLTLIHRKTMLKVQ
jgi:hypothetical protein